MKRLFAHYTLVRLLPQADAGEFANIGVVLACPETGYFGFRLMKKQRRVTQFFEEITRDLLTKLRKERLQQTGRRSVISAGTQANRGRYAKLQTRQDWSNWHQQQERY
jgi:Protein of unknown function (DUF3037)